MSCLFFTAPMCKGSINYILSWLFFLILSSCIIAMVFQYPFSRGNNNNELMCRFLFSLGVTMFVGLISRFACVNDYKKIQASRGNLSEKEYLLL